MWHKVLQEYTNIVL